jgi:oligopeptide/dipeptide ABC transporter ATP-binding protein
MPNELLEVQNLRKLFPITKGILFKKIEGYVHAVDEIDFTIHEGETFGLVGESGSGKTTTGKLIIGLYKPTSGKILFEGRDIASLKKSEMKKVRRKMGVVFQDPFSSLDPRKTLGSIVKEPLEIHRIGSKKERESKVMHLVESVGLSREHVNRFPHQFSGGQRQRIAIARALALNPKLLVADEAVSALDVSIQAQTINLMKDLQKEFGLTCIFIAHDLNVVKHISSSVAVMYVGKILERASKEEIFNNPKHPYTKALLASVPIPDPLTMKTRNLDLIKGEIPSAVNPPEGCRFHPRCPYTNPICRKNEPKLIDIGKNHYVACHLLN